MASSEWLHQAATHYSLLTTHHLPPAQPEHRLLAEHVPEPPRRVEAQRRPPRIESHRLFHLGPGRDAKLAEILDGAEVNVGRIVPCIGQIVGPRHAATKHDLHPDAPMAEI